MKINLKITNKIWDSSSAFEGLAIIILVRDNRGNRAYNIYQGVRITAWIN